MKIIVDIRETQLYEKLISYNLSITGDVDGKNSEENIEKEVLNIGDVILKFNDNTEMCVIERKTIQDLLSSIKDGRYEEQSYRLIHASGHNPHNILYIIEGQLLHH
jgi:ERCC4-type nuclease